MPYRNVRCVTSLPSACDSIGGGNYLDAEGPPGGTRAKAAAEPENIATKAEADLQSDVEQIK